MVRLAALVLTSLLMVAACSGASSPEVPVGSDGVADPVLVDGRDIYSSSCANCHGASGQGTRRAPPLNAGGVVTLYPDIEDQIAVVSEGRGAMPPFVDRFTEAEIEAVVRYTREVLSDVDS
jgi:mono/diheme cytochrome c family protein